MALIDHPAATWEPMQGGEVFYRRQKLYSVGGKLPNLADYYAAGCAFGGPIALMRDSTKLVALGRSAPSFSRSQVQIYSPAGDGLLLFSWDQGKIVKFGWTGDERLVLLNEEGLYRLYDLQGDYEQFSLGTEASESGVVDAKIYQNGLVALTGTLTLLEVQGWKGGKPMTLANPNLAAPPNAWAVIPSDLNISRHVEVLMSVDATVISVDNLESTDQRLSRGPFTHVSPSPNGKLLALLTYNGTLWVVSSDFQRSITEYETSTTTGAEGPIKQVEWCGNDAIIVAWENLVLLVGPYSDTLLFPYSTATFVISERDGIRIMSQDLCDFVQKVPASLLSVFRYGSTSPAAILYDAWESFSKRQPKADESIRSIKPDLVKAVDLCIAAAGHEWEPNWQRKLLNAAKFGRGYLDRYDPTDFIKMGQDLKVLNAVRFFEIGIPLSYDQYLQATPSHLISRLLSRNLHLLALRISNYLGLKSDVVLKHWAGAKIMKSKASVSETDSTADDEVCKLIVDKFEQLGGSDFSYADIAKRAWEVGRIGLATKLLDFETKASDQVPLLLQMKEDRLALAKAVDSGDTDLIYQVLLHLQKRLALGSFFKLIEDGGPKLLPARRLLEVYAREQNREMLRDFYYSDDRRVESAVLCLDEAATFKDPHAVTTAVKNARKFFSEDKDRAFEAKMMGEYTKLLEFQLETERECENRVNFRGLSVNDTITLCFTNGMGKRGDAAKKAFGVPDKRFCYLKLYALTSAQDWEGLDALGKTKSPIGFEPFVRHLLEKGHPKQAAGFVPKCDGPKRADLYVDCGEWRAAAVVCKERGDKAKMEELRKRSPNTVITREIDQIASSMK
ncbi:vacuolar assembling/sorting protein VPS16 [Flagelloscypha sp. PMI_526]|nr:vacuolar assembling/sorting protein VPS16 [Flagelloscypha sp. PMI_526]